MSTFDAFKIAGKALMAQSQRMSAISSNMANAETVASTPEQAYKAKQVVFEAVLEDAKGSSAAVRVKDVQESKAEAKALYNPDHPLADENGYVYAPDINPASEMVDFISASRSYQTNADIMNTTKTLMLKTLSIGQQ